ncbi:MAG TPA: hypothetical protein PLD27_12115 [bacterium]|nr:hypothetical protein [bacterium]
MKKFISFVFLCFLTSSLLASNIKNPFYGNKVLLFSDVVNDSNWHVLSSKLICDTNSNETYNVLLTKSVDEIKLDEIKIDTSSFPTQQQINQVINMLNDSNFVIFDSGYFVYETINNDSKIVSFNVTDRVKFYNNQKYKQLFYWGSGSDGVPLGRIKAIGYIEQ